MLRLRVHGVNPGVWRGVADRLRLRGETVEDESFSAVAFVDAAELYSPTIADHLNDGKHVLLAADGFFERDVLETLARTARQKQVRFDVVNPDRYLPSRQLLKQQLDAGKLGAVGLVRLLSWQHGGKVGGSLARDLDLACWLIGKAPTTVFATEDSSQDVVSIHLGFADGAMALVCRAFQLPPGDAYRSLHVIGAAGAAYADDAQNMQLLYRGGHPQAVRTEEGSRALVSILQEFVDAIGGGDSTARPTMDWRTTWSLLEAVGRSFASRQAVALEGV